jgi:hypothetical protein
VASSGIATACLCYAGHTGSGASALNESWNGTSWTEIADMNTARASGGGSGTAASNALVFGGETPPARAFTESFNGTAWTEIADLNAEVSGNTGTGTITAALSFGGSPDTDGTQEFTDPTLTVKTADTD